jgi:hypothetical protein
MEKLFHAADIASDFTCDIDTIQFNNDLRKKKAILDILLDINILQDALKKAEDEILIQLGYFTEDDLNDR